MNPGELLVQRGVLTPEQLQDQDELGRLLAE